MMAVVGEQTRTDMNRNYPIPILFIRFNIYVHNRELATFNERFTPRFGHSDVISERLQPIKKIVAGLIVFSRTGNV